MDDARESKFDVKKANMGITGTTRNVLLFSFYFCGSDMVSPLKWHTHLSRAPNVLSLLKEKSLNMKEGNIPHERSSLCCSPLYNRDSVVVFLVTFPFF